jgi:hypothetical protein
MSQKMDEKKKMKKNSRRTYQVPNLIIYGALRDLTAAGTGTTPEPKPGGSQGGPNKQRF